MSTNSNQKLQIVGLVLLGLVALALVWYVFRPGLPDFNENGEVACTLEAKLCPDGSAVGRVPPSCDFAACPGEIENIPTSWETVTDVESGITFSYPPALSTRYLSLVDWPPRVRTETGPFTCTEAGAPGDRAGETRREVVGGRTYCVTEITEGAAGSVYSQYAYATTMGDEVVFLTFSLRRPQCGNFTEVEQVACASEQDSFDISALINQIVGTLLMH